MRYRRFMPLAALLIPAVVLLAGCQPPRARTFTGTGMDMFAPVHMRLHPLTRFLPAAPATASATRASTTAPAGAAAAVEARLEFTDQFGDVTKAVGTVTFQLYAHSGFSLDGRGKLLAEWSRDISTAAANHEHYDGITRTYLFRLALPAGTDAGAAARGVLAATFHFPPGAAATGGGAATLSDQITLPGS